MSSSCRPGALSDDFERQTSITICMGAPGAVDDKKYSIMGVLRLDAVKDECCAIILSHRSEPQLSF